MEKTKFAEEIKGNRIVLKRHPLTFEHARECFDLIQKNKEIFKKYFSWAEKTESPEYHYESFLMDQNKDFDNCKVFEYMITLDNKFIGQIGFFDINWRIGCGVIGYWLDKDYWGKGYMPEAVKILEDYAFELGFYRIEIQHDLGNDNSKRVIEKSGYTFEGVSRSKSLIGDLRHDVLTYSKLRTEWKK